MKALPQAIHRPDPLDITLDTGDVINIGVFGPANSASGNYTVGAGDTSADYCDLHACASAGAMSSAISRAVLIRAGTGRTSQISPSAFSSRRKYQVRSTSHQKKP